MKIYSSLLELPARFADDRYALKQKIWTMFPNRERNDRCFLFGVVRNKNDIAVVKVRSTVQPRQDGFEVLDYSKQEVEFKEGERFAFQIFGCPLRRDSKTRKEYLIKNGYDQIEWLNRKMKGITNFDKCSIHECKRVAIKNKEKISIVEFRGVFIVEDAFELTKKFICGVGKKGCFGSGLISVKGI